jgi:feruloyl-CoA synthase
VADLRAAVQESSALPEKHIAALRPVRMGPCDAVLEHGPRGVRYVRSARALGPYAARLTDRLDHWAERSPARMFIADRQPDGSWREVTYARARHLARAVAQALLERGLGADRPIVVLSGNDVEHAILGLAAQYAGVPYAPISPAYSLLSRDHVKLRQIVELLRPALVFAADGEAFGPALDAVLEPEVEVVFADRAPPARASTAFDALTATPTTTAVDRATASVGPDTIAKLLFTSGSTGPPKAVINTQRMLCCNQVMIHSELAFLCDRPPVMVDWLPWNHTAGGNHNFGIVLYNGGSLYVDDGAPTPEGIGRTVRNLTEVAPTLYFNVPKGYEVLGQHLERDPALRASFFQRLELMEYAGAGLPPHLWDRLQDIAMRETGERIVMITGYGSTETAPFAFTCTRPVDRPGMVGLPAPGLEAKLVPSGDKLELRVRGPNVTPGYWGRPDLSAAVFDDEGYYRIGDALRLVDEADVNAGFAFDGRLGEDFKLSTGTWVDVACVRAAVIRALAPYARDAVIAGHDADFVSALVFPDLDACRRLAGLGGDLGPAQIIGDATVRRAFAERLDELASSATSSSNRVARLVLLAESASIDSGEMTDKGSLNQHAVLARRAALVCDLYADEPPAHVLTARAET